MSATRVLVTGASVTGPAVAYWLARAGLEVTVLERAPQPRSGGQNIDIRAGARDVIRMMGLEEAVLARNTGEVGIRFLDEHGDVVSEFPVDEREDSDGPTAELEILRGALAQVLTEACPDTVRWRYGDEIVGVDQDADGVDVELAGGGRERFDLLVVAEGVGSSTRALVFDEEPEVRELGIYITYGTIARTEADDDWWRAVIVPGGRQLSLRPDDEGTIRAMLNFRVDTPVLDGLDDATLRAELRNRFDDAGWEAPRILDGFDEAPDLYVDWLRQVRCPTWHRGRVCLLGDAAWSVTTLAGFGTSLAVTGAYVLAAHLSQAGPEGHEEAFARFEEWMRPTVEEVQHLPPGVPRLATPTSRAGVQALRLATRIAALPHVADFASRLTSGPEFPENLPVLDARGAT